MNILEHIVLVYNNNNTNADQWHRWYSTNMQVILGLTEGQWVNQAFVGRSMAVLLDIGEQCEKEKGKGKQREKNEIGLPLGGGKDASENE